MSTALTFKLRLLRCAERISDSGMQHEIYASIGAAIRKRRDAIGMTQKTLAEKTGLSRTSITNIERGGQALMVHQLLELAKALGVSPTNLIQSVKISEERGDQKPVPEEMKVLLDRLEKTTSRSRSR